VTPREAAELAKRCHALNNLFAKILWASELALEEAPDRCPKPELQAIVRLAQTGGELVEDLRSVASEG